MTNKTHQFEEWIAELKRVAVAEFYFSEETVFDPLAWKETYYDDGLTPKEALQEDITNL